MPELPRRWRGYMRPTPTKVVAVVHGGVIGHILAHATGASPFAFNGADNGSISRIVLHQDGIKTRSFNDNIHVQSTLHTGSGQLT